MNEKNCNNHWPNIVKLMHWLIAWVIISTAIIGLICAEMQTSPSKLTLFVWHKSFGVSALFLMLIRLSIRFFTQTPDHTKELTAGAIKLSNGGHALIYLIAISLPLSGWLLTSYANYPFKWFGLFAVPNIAGASEASAELAAQTHFVLFWILFILVLGHVLMALKHHFTGHTLVKKMLPMQMKLLPTVMLLIALSLLSAGGAWFISNNNTIAHTPQHSSLLAPDSAAQLSSNSVEQNNAPTATINATAANWHVAIEQSKLGFTNTYAGVEFNGVFKLFKPQIWFSPEQIDGSVFHVSIDLASVDTNASDRDGTLLESEFFNVAEFPKALYFSKKFTKLDDQNFIAHGTLTLKNITAPVDLTFTWQVSHNDAGNEQAELSGTAQLNRNTFNIGEGSWATDDSIGFDIKINTHLKLNKPLTSK